MLTTVVLPPHQQKKTRRGLTRTNADLTRIQQRNAEDAESHVPTTGGRGGLQTAWLTTPAFEIVAQIPN